MLLREGNFGTFFWDRLLIGFTLDLVLSSLIRIQILLHLRLLYAKFLIPKSLESLNCY